MRCGDAGPRRNLAAAVGISLCQAGNAFGPIAFLLIYNIPAFLIRIFGAIKGYELGIGFLDEAQKTGLMQKIMACGNPHTGASSQSTARYCDNRPRRQP